MHGRCCARPLLPTFRTLSQVRELSRVPDMRVVIGDVPAAVLAERRVLGLDRFDEVWDGVWHMVPSPNNEHQRLEVRLASLLLPLCDDLGLELRVELNLLAPGVPTLHDFRVPDLMVYRPECWHALGVIGPASLVVEVRSPDDESFEKLPFFEKLGVGEVLIIDRDTKVIRRWVNGADGLVESSAGEGGRHRLECLPVEIWSEGFEVHLDIEGVHTAF